LYNLKRIPFVVTVYSIPIIMGFLCPGKNIRQNEAWTVVCRRIG